MSDRINETVFNSRRFQQLSGILKEQTAQTDASVQAATTAQPASTTETPVESEYLNAETMGTRIQNFLDELSDSRSDYGLYYTVADALLNTDTDDGNAEGLLITAAKNINPKFEEYDNEDIANDIKHFIDDQDYDTEQNEWGESKYAGNIKMSGKHLCSWSSHGDGYGFIIDSTVPDCVAAYRAFMDGIKQL
jgi:hypothetical protein